jgi:membrane protein required for colicin V production
MMIGSMALVDWIIVAIIAGAVIAGFARGFFRSVFSLGGLLVGLIVASWNYARVAHFLERFIHSPDVANGIGFLIIAILIMVLSAIIGSLLAKLFEKVGLGCLDRIAGAVFGLFEGALFVTVCIFVTVAFFPRSQWLTESRLLPYFSGPLHVSTTISPKKLANQFRHQLEILEQESSAWAHAHKSK